MWPVNVTIPSFTETPMAFALTDASQASSAVTSLLKSVSAFMLSLVRYVVW